jgi:hypothetical protein
MSNKFQQLISKLLKEDGECAPMAGTTTATLGNVSPSYGIGKTTPATQGDMSITGGIGKKKRQQKERARRILRRTLPRDL